jgi:hypothetical protein
VPDIYDADEHTRQVLAYRKHPERMMGKLTIRDMQGKYGRFDNPFPEQVDAMVDFADPTAKTIVHVKPRQIGDSTVGLGWNFCYNYWAVDPVRTLVVTDKDDTNAALWEKLQDYYHGLPKGMQRPLLKSNTKEMIFEDTKAGFRCLSSRSPAGGRGWTYQRAHFDEVAYWFHDKDVWAAVTSSMHEGPHEQVIVMSSPNGPGNLFHEQALAAQNAVRDGDLSYRFRFFRWCDHPTYRRPLLPGFEPTQEEHQLMLAHKIDLEQIAWRRDRITGPKGIGLDRFRREYPLTMEEGFLVFDGSWFNVEYLNKVFARLQAKFLKTEVQELRIFRKPERQELYAIGVDPSWCNGGDWAVAQVLDSRGNQCATLSLRKGGETAFADKVAQLSAYYNKARCLVEWNTGGAGSVVVRRLSNQGIPLWTKPGVRIKYGSQQDPGTPYWTTSKGSKEEAYAHLRNVVDADELELNDLLTVQELLHIREVHGHIAGQDGYHDDHAMALALAEWNRRSLPRRYRETSQGEPWRRPKPSGQASDAWSSTRE